MPTSHIQEVFAMMMIYSEHADIDLDGDIKSLFCDAYQKGIITKEEFFNIQQGIKQPR